MLITNFSTGELSEDLFGRIDLEQYYKGAAKIENFDIIPTGGIQRRRGTKRLLISNYQGRIIPFIVNRELSFLFLLTPGAITVYKLEDGEISEESNAVDNSVQQYADLKEINEIQYAQNFDTMILCHENYPPLEAIYNSGNIKINRLEIDFYVRIVAGENITDDDKASYENKDDEQYIKNNWLTMDGNYPISVSFYNGRLVFAGTKNNRQRIFASSIQDNVSNENTSYSFSTKKIFLTQKREYCTIFGQIDKDDTSIINTDSQFVINSFTKPAEKYFVDSQLYAPDTRIEYINLNRVKLTKGMKMPSMLFDIEKIRADLQKNIEIYDSKNNNPTPIIVFTRNYEVVYWNGSLNIQYNIRYEGSVTCTIKASSISIRHYARRYDRNYDGSYGWHTFADQESSKVLPNNAVKVIENDPSLYTNEILKLINNLVLACKNDYRPPATPSNNYSDNYSEYEDRKLESIQKLYENVNETMLYKLESVYGEERFYNFPIQNMANVMARIINTDKTYISLYTKELISDEYPTPECGFTFEIASDINDAIRWLAVNKGLIVGTETGEWIVPPDVTAVNIYATRNSRFGSDKIQGTVIGDATCFFQAGKKGLVEYYIPQQDNNFRANNMAMLATQMLRESEAVEFDYTSSPYTKLLITREDGKIASLLYDRAYGVFAWTRFSVAKEGKVKSLAVVPGKSGYDDVYLLVEYKTPDENVKEYHLELFEYDGNVYLDSYTEVNASNFTAAMGTYGLTGIQIALCRITKGEDGEDLYETLDPSTTPDWTIAGKVYIGYPYKSVIRTMPVLANSKMGKQRITSLTFRFLHSYLPLVSSIASGRNIKTDTITNIKTPYSGVRKIPFPGTWDEDVQAELTHEQPEPVKIIALDAEVQ